MDVTILRVSTSTRNRVSARNGNTTRLCLPRNMSGYLILQRQEKESMKEAVRKSLYLPMACGSVLLTALLLWIVGSGM